MLMVGGDDGDKSGETDGETLEGVEGDEAEVEGELDGECK